MASEKTFLGEILCHSYSILDWRGEATVYVRCTLMRLRRDVSATREKKVIFLSSAESFTRDSTHHTGILRERNSCRRGCIDSSGTVPLTKVLYVYSKWPLPNSRGYGYPCVTAPSEP